MSDQRVVLFAFAGRRENMEVAWPFYERLLSDWPGLELHLWDMTRRESDHVYVQSLHDPESRVSVRSEFWPGDNDWPIGCRKRIKRARWCGCKECRPAPFEKPYAWYAERPEYADAVFVKTDDDVLFFETHRFGDLLDELLEHPNAVVSANVVNNVVSAKHSPPLRDIMEERFAPVTQRDWFDLHALAEYATLSHDWFLRSWVPWPDDRPRDVVRTLPGERISINCIAFTHATMVRMAAAMGHLAFRKIGDEGTVDQNFLPRLCRSFTVAHLQFGPQRVALPEETWQAYRDQYAAVARDYLA